MLSAAHLIVVPNALLSQWESELKRFFQVGMVQVFLVPSTHEEFNSIFISAEGPFQKSPLDDCFKIILCTDLVSFLHW